MIGAADQGKIKLLPNTDYKVSLGAKIYQTANGTKPSREANAGAPKTLRYNYTAYPSSFSPVVDQLVEVKTTTDSS